MSVQYKGLIRFAGLDAAQSKLFNLNQQIMEAQVTVSTDLSIAETFGDDGIISANSACAQRTEMMMRLASESFNWAFLQLCLGRYARDAAALLPDNELFVIEAGDIVADTATYDVTWTPEAGTTVYAADDDGIQYSVVFSAGSPNTVAIGDATTPAVAGTRVLVSYVPTPSGTNNEIAIGESTVIGNIQVGGIFSGCGENLLIHVPKGAVRTTFDANIASGSRANAGLEIQAIKDASGNLGYFKRITL